MKKLNSLMLLALVLLLFSCRTEILNDETTAASPEKNKFQLTSKRISLDQSPHKLSLLPEINKIETELKKSKQNAFGKTIDHVDGVSIDTEHVIYIENGPNYHTYTFNIKNTPSSLLQNLVLTPLPDGSYKKLIFTYNFTDAEKLNIFKGIPVDTKGKTSITDLNNPAISSKAGGCVYAEETIWHECSEGIHNESNLAEWALCTASAPPSVYTIAYWNCAGGNGSSDGGNGSNPGNDNGGNGPGSGSGCVADAFENPTDPVNSPGPCSGGVPTQPNISTSFAWFLYYLPNDLGSVISTNQISEFYQGFKAYYDANANNSQAIDFIMWGLQFKKDNPNVSWEQFQPMLTFAQNFLQQNPNTINPEQIFTRLKELDDALTQNPNLLLDIPCNQLPEWQTLVNHPIPQSVKNKIFQVNGNTGWFSSAVIQNLDYSNSFTINMDVYPVKISNMPEKSPGVKYTPAEFFDYFRKNINDFTDVNHGKFYPVVEPYYGIDDTSLWFSNNPLGSLITIKIPADNGTVVCSGWGNQAWIFTTVKSPWDGEHPVSGNRLFGYSVDASGDMIIYTRGVDRFTTKISNNALQYTAESFGYSEAKKMWKTMQQKVSA
ncbi:MAG: hypothetical protein L0G39_12190, partial [Chryseobacterium sp.]|nr:hypothetical protein [Chryseobacterium sp.]